jgi:UDP-glucose 4-epimerase
VVRSVLHLTISQVNKIFLENAFGAVMHFAAIAYVGESTMELLRCKS